MINREEFAYRVDPLVAELGTMARIALLVENGEYRPWVRKVELLRRARVNAETQEEETWILAVNRENSVEVTRYANLARQWEGVKRTQAGRNRFNEYISSQMQKWESPPLSP